MKLIFGAHRYHLYEENRASRYVMCIFSLDFILFILIMAQNEAIVVDGSSSGESFFNFILPFVLG